jgi:hypothetical protein
MKRSKIVAMDLKLWQRLQSQQDLTSRVGFPHKKFPKISNVDPTILTAMRGAQHDKIKCVGAHVRSQKMRIIHLHHFWIHISKT